MISHNRNVLKTLAPTFLIEEDLRLFNLVFTLNLGTSKPLDGNESVNLPKEIQNFQTVLLLIVKYLPRFHCVVLSASGLYIIITGRGGIHSATLPPPPPHCSWFEWLVPSWWCSSRGSRHFGEVEPLWRKLVIGQILGDISPPNPSFLILNHF